MFACITTCSGPMSIPTSIVVVTESTFLDSLGVNAHVNYNDGAYANLGKMAEDLDYVPMPSKVTNAIQKVWTSQVKDASGRPLFTASN